jgi:phosphotriesterase-related protein
MQATPPSQTASVQTVNGPVNAADLGFTLPHEHVFTDVSGARLRAPETERARFIRDHPVSPEIYGDLRYDPYGCLDNLKLEDEALAICELQKFAAAGGRTIMDQTTSASWGRDPIALQRVSDATGLNIVAGCGSYLSYTRVPDFDELTIDEIAQQITDELRVGIDGTGVRAGFIGEIAVADPDSGITPADERALRGAARAQATNHVPMSVHLVKPLADEVLDIIAEEGGNLDAVVLCHIAQQAIDDLDYQLRVAERGAWLAFDNIGLDWYHPDWRESVGCEPRSDREFAQAILRLLSAGAEHRILLSTDVFVKMQLTHYGGFGYAHLPNNFLPRLRNEGVEDAMLERLTVANPAELFVTAAARSELE